MESGGVTFDLTGAFLTGVVIVAALVAAILIFLRRTGT
jgi:hypothetical protein